MKWHTQAVNLTTNMRVKIDSTLPDFSATKYVTQEFSVDNSAKNRYRMILGTDLLKPMGLNLKNSEHVIKGGEGTFEGSTSPIIDLGIYEFKGLNRYKI